MKKILVFAVVVALGCPVISIADDWQIPWAGDRPKNSSRPDRGRDRDATVNPRTGEALAPISPGYVGTRDGTYYAPAGPSGVINTRTGEFIPTN